MKLDQEQIKKIFASSIVLILLLYVYFTFLLGPVQKSQQDATAGIASLQPQIADAKKQISRTTTLQNQAPEAASYLTNLKNSIPDGAPIAWFPPKIVEYFKSRGIDKCSAHIMTEGPSNLPGFRKLVWSIELPKVEYVPLGLAISSLENDEPLLTVLNVSIDAGREEAQYQRATLVVATLVKS